MKTQYLQNLSLDMNLIDVVCQNIKSFCKQNCMLRMYSKPTEFIENGTEIDKNFQCAVQCSAVQCVAELSSQVETLYIRHSMQSSLKY